MSPLRPTPRVCPKLSQSPVALFLFAIAILAAAPVAGSFPQTVDYDGQVVGTDGAPLAGSFDLTLDYFAPDGRLLHAESMTSVMVENGHLRVVLGSGEPARKTAFGSLGAVFAAYPEIGLEITIGDHRYGPRVGILPKGHSLKSRLVAAGLRATEDDDPHWEHYEAEGGATAVQAAVLAPVDAFVGAKPDSATFRSRPYTLPVVGPMLSRPVSELPIAVQQPLEKEREINPPRHEALFDRAGNRFGSVAPRQDDALAGAQPTQLTPALTQDFEGVGNVNGVLPPDTEGTVGPNHYVQVVNLSFAIYDKSGTLLSGPSNTNTLWAGFGGPCQNDNDGDAIFLYDEEADRFVLTQFAVTGSNQSVCWAVSQTSNPLGSYYLYEVVTPRFPDYFKVGVWPDSSNNAYFFGTNSGFQNQYDVFAVDRANMLAGNTARPMQFFQNFVNLMMPADLDGYNGGAGLPPAGSPGIFYTFRDGGESYFSNPPTDSIDIWEFAVDWNTPANSSFTQVQTITPAQGLADFNWTVCGFFNSNCIPQPGTAQGIDSASWWPMQRLVYRNFGSHETLVGSWTVDVLATGNRAAPRWFELRDTGSGWTIHQQGTHSPDAIHRWMPSAAIDGSGNIAIGYSRGDGSNFASIYYAVHEAGVDALGTLSAEALMTTATGAQTNTAARWGDYSSMELDPADDCTFWFTHEYLTTTGSAPWRTRVGSFKVPSCGGPPAPTFTLSCSPSSFTIQQGANDVSTCTVTAANGYTGTVNLSCVGAPAGIGCGFAPSSLVFSADGPQNSTLTLSVGGSQATGNYAFDTEATDGSITRAFGLDVEVVPAGSNGPQDAVFDPGLQAPACFVPGSECDSLALVDGRDGKGPEPNEPNTIGDSCADGTSGAYHVDESNDRIVVSTLDGGNFTEGDTVEIAATVWAWSTFTDDTLDLYHADDANSPSWTYIGSFTPPGTDQQTITTQYVLPAGTLQAVRARFRYQGSPSPCATGGWDDHDDLVFAVEPAGCTINADCDDGLFCNGAETCNVGTGQCQAGTPPSCNDAQFCNGVETCNETTDSCDPGTAPCDPVTETCDEGTDMCEPVGCTINADCDDGLFCNGAETCNVGTGQCEAGTPPACDDGLFCNGVETCNESTDSCDPGAPPVCADGLFCNGTETCNESTDSCDPGTPPACDDGQFCNGVESCNESTDSCDPGTDPCSPGDICNEATDMCDPGGTDPEIWMSFRTNTVVPGIGTVTDDDVVSYNEVTGVWTLRFDGSDVGLSSFEIDGLAVVGPGELLLSFRQAGNVGGVTADDSDVVRFVGTLGPNTSGTFSLYFDGSDVGLTSNGEDVDALALDGNGDLLVSTQGGFSGTGASGADEDLFLFDGTVGPNTSGSFTKVFDGSDVGLSSSSSEDVDAASVTSTGLLFSTVGSFSVPGASGADEDVAEFFGVLIDPTSGSFSLRQDLSALGISVNEDVGSMDLVE